VIILSCKYCKNKDLVSSKFCGEFECTKCHRLLHLWEVDLLHLSLMPENLPKVTEPTLTQVGLK
jgi:hypothetical protein